MHMFSVFHFLSLSLSFQTNQKHSIILSSKWWMIENSTDGNSFLKSLFLLALYKICHNVAVSLINFGQSTFHFSKKMLSLKVFSLLFDDNYLMVWKILSLIHFAAHSSFYYKNFSQNWSIFQVWNQWKMRDFLWIINNEYVRQIFLSSVAKILGFRRAEHQVLIDEQLEGKA